MVILMNRKGFTLIEVIVGLFLVGLVSVVSFPIIQNSINNYNKVQESQHMFYLCEMVVERLRAKDSSLDEIFNELEGNSEIIVSTISTIDLENYKCKITKTKDTDLFMNLDVRIYIDNEMRDSQFVEYKTVIKR